MTDHETRSRFLEWVFLIAAGIAAWVYFGHVLNTAWNDTSASVAARVEELTR